MIDNLNKALDYIEKGTALLARETDNLTALDPTIARFVEVRMLKDRAKEIAGEINDLAERLAYELVPAALERSGLTSARHRLGLIALKQRTSASIIADHRADAYKWLRSNGLGGLIIETVNAQSLSGAYGDLLGEGKELPEKFFKTSIRNYASLSLAGKAK